MTMTSVRKNLAATEENDLLQHCSEDTKDSKACPLFKLSPVEIKKSAVNRIVCSGNEGGFVRTQKQSKGRHFFRFPHAAYRLGLRERSKHFLFTARIILFQIAIDKGGVYPRR